MDEGICHCGLSVLRFKQPILSCHPESSNICNDGPGICSDVIEEERAVSYRSATSFANCGWLLPVSSFMLLVAMICSVHDECRPYCLFPSKKTLVFATTNCPTAAGTGSLISKGKLRRCSLASPAIFSEKAHDATTAHQNLAKVAQTTA